MKRQEIFDQINEERERQDRKFGAQQHKPIEWCAILGEEVGEVNKEALELHFDFFDKNEDPIRRGKALRDYRTELTQVAAVAVAMIENIDKDTSAQSCDTCKKNLTDCRFWAEAPENGSTCKFFIKHEKGGEK